MLMMMKIIIDSAKPYPFEVNAGGNRHPQEKIALVVIDMQRDFVEKGGFGEALGNNVEPLAAIVPTIRRLLDTFRQLQLPVIHTVEGHRSDLSDCPPSKRFRGIQKSKLLENEAEATKGRLKIGDEGPMGRILVLGEKGNSILPELAPLPNEFVVTKPGKGAFYNTNLDQYLKENGITHLVFTGVTTEVCVQTTMREANDRGYEW
eukprot:GEZU01012002.1.p1 GENE.GEZU01012002.1~~GEZU01012002.1.p1  ORF type:complete len:205 (+),score=31.87 GEZU01012002.1:71-685(+)